MRGGERWLLESFARFIADDLLRLIRAFDRPPQIAASFLSLHPTLGDDSLTATIGSLQLASLPVGINRIQVRPVDPQPPQGGLNLSKICLGVLKSTEASLVLHGEL